MAAFGGSGGGNVSVKEHIVRDMRQQMERRGPEWLTAAIHQKEEVVGVKPRVH